MTAEEVVAACRAKAVELTVTGGRLRFRGPAGAVGPELRAALAEHKAEVLAAVASRCPGCGGPADAKRRCWRCHDRACERCGRPTGSAFISSCIVCDFGGAAG